MFPMVDIIRFACSNVNVARVQKGSTDVPRTNCHVGAKLVNTPGSLCKVDEFLVEYAEKLASWYQKKDRCVSGEHCGLVLLVPDPRHVIVSIVSLC